MGRKNMCKICRFKISPTVSQDFHGNDKANLQNQSRFWKQRESILSFKNLGSRSGAFSISSARRRGRQVLLKTVGGRYAKRAEWVLSLYQAVLEEFKRFN